MRAPVLAVGDGALGFWGALREVFPQTCESSSGVDTEHLDDQGNTNRYMPTGRYGGGFNEETSTMTRPWTEAAWGVPAQVDGVVPMFVVVNRGKGSIDLDLPYPSA
jgi:hypothetical protein